MGKSKKNILSIVGVSVLAVIPFYFCNTDELVLEIDGKEVEFKCGTIKE